jgi:hypothetical protein
MAKPFPMAAVAQGVEPVGDLADLGSQAAHLADAARVVGDGAVGVHRHRDAHGGEHPDRGDADAVEVRHRVRDVDRAADHEQRDRDGAHPHGQAGDDIGGRAGE